MNSLNRMLAALAIALSGVLAISSDAMANGGPFLVKYPNGDPAARGIPARLDPNLKPTREERLRVVKEDLTITFVVDPLSAERAAAPTPVPTPKRAVPSPSAAPAAPTPAAVSRANSASQPAAPNTPGPGILPMAASPGDDQANSPPLAVVEAAYTIENSTPNLVEIDFGFPILRGIYISPFSMFARPDVQVRLDASYVSTEIISNSQIYGVIRQQARDVVEKAIASDAELARLVAKVRATGVVRDRAREAIRAVVGSDAALSDAVVNDSQLSPLADSPAENENAEVNAARTALGDYLARVLKWQASDVALMVEFASLDFRNQASHPRDRSSFFGEPATANLGPLSAIGEQKATQFLAGLAACFDPKVATAYEEIFSAWGGDVRERSLDLRSGEVRPREIVVTTEALETVRPYRHDTAASDPTIYARVDYLDPKANLTARDKASCETILKNLPVVFTFSPMNLVYYRVKFPANSTHTLTVSYKQFMYADTREPGSYQLAYVVHPASMWKDFGPINLEIAVPEGVPMRSSVASQQTGVEERDLPADLPARSPKQKNRLAIHKATVGEKTGELFVAIDSRAWSKVTNEKRSKQDADRQASR